MKRESIAVIVITLNEAATIFPCLQRVREAAGVQVLVADGGSTDATRTLARQAGATVVTANRGRGSQLQAGAALARGDLLLFLHGDTLLPPAWERGVRAALANPTVAFGAFRLGIQARGWRFRLVEQGANLRARLLSLPYGDQALFLRQDLFRQVGGYRQIPCMEDLDLVRRLRRHGRFLLAPLTVRTAARRWQRLGIIRTILLNQLLVAAFVAGIPPETLARVYNKKTHPRNVTA